MRNVWNPAVHPPQLSRQGRPGFDYAVAQQREDVPRDKFPPHWRSSDVRGVLKARCGTACAYCLDIIGRSGEDVEHYRPKNLYWFLAYMPSNYLSSCRRCNSSRKINRFPLEDDQGRATDFTGLGSEARLLLDPASDDVECVLRIDLETKEYNWAIEPTAPAQLKARAEHTIKFFRLNTDTELRRARIEAIQLFLEEALSNNPTCVIRARRHMSRFTQHGAAVRSVAQQQHPSLLPSSEEELQWHITQLFTLLELAMAPGSDPTFVEMLDYALATIRSDPPQPIQEATVAVWYKNLQIGTGTLDDRVAPFVDELRTADPHE
jgi:uncharacterized protein (TIGR02646 family)